MTGAAEFGRMEVTNYADVSFNNGIGNISLPGSGSFSLGGLGTHVEVVKPFEVIHDESPLVNGTLDPNVANDTAEALPSDLSTRITTLSLSELGHAKTVGSVSTLFNAFVGADDDGTPSYRMSGANGLAFTGTDSGLKTTEGNETIKLFADSANSTILWGVTGADFASGTKVFAAYIDERGQVWLVQFKAIAHDLDGATISAYDDAISILTDIRVVMSLTDADGDTVSAVSNTPLKLTFQDDGPAAHASSTSGNEGQTLTGTLSFVAGADGATVTAINGTTLAFDGDGWSQGIDGGHGTLKLKADGSYSFAAHQDDPWVSNGTDQFTFTVTDGDGDKSQAQFQVTISDTIDPVTVSLSGSSVPEGSGAAYVFTATLSAQSHGVTTIVTDQGTITIANGQTVGTLTLGANGEDVYLDASNLTATITSATGGNFENLTIAQATATATISDTIDPVTATLTAGEPTNTDTGVTIPYTITLSGSPGVIVPDGPLVFTLSSGHTITLVANQASVTTNLFLPQGLTAPRSAIRLRT